MTNVMTMSFAMQMSSFITGMTFLVWFIKRRTDCLKRSEALLMMSSFVLILLGIPDFQIPIAVSLKISCLVSLLMGLIILSFYLVYYEKLSVNRKPDNEANTLVVDFIKQHRNVLPINYQCILILIPAYNEETNLREMLKFAPSKLNDLPVVLLVIDDGSFDNTSKVASEHAFVLSLPKNRGGGYALFTGFLVAKKLNVPYVVTMDADGQHIFSDLEKLMAPIFEEKSEIALGSRFQTDSMYSNKFRSMGIHLFNLVLRIILGHQISDCSNAYRAITMNALKQLDLREERHHTAEFVILATKNKISISEIPVHIQNRFSGKSKKGNSILYALRFTRTILTSWWRA